MERKKKSEFNKVFNAWDILMIAFGAMIGWGWVVSSGNWIQNGGVFNTWICNWWYNDFLCRINLC